MESICSCERGFDMAAAKEHLFVSAQPDKLVLLAEIPAAGSSGAEPAVTFRLLVEQSYDYGAGAGQDVDTMEDVTCRVPLRDMNCRGAVGRAFGELLAGLDYPMLHPEIAPEAEKAAARIRARCGDGDCVDELGGVEFRLRDMLIDALDEPAPEEDYESDSDMEFGEFDLHGARKVHDQSAASFYEEDDDDDDGCGAQFSARPYHGPSDGTLLLSGFEARSDGPEITDQHELTSWDVQRLVHMALDGGDGNMEDDEAYQRALAGGTPLSQASRAAILCQALQSTGHPQQQISKSPSPMFPMRTGF